MCLPITSFEEYPKTLSAPLFQLVMVPSSLLLRIASSEKLTMEANNAWKSISAFATSMLIFKNLSVQLFSKRIQAHNDRVNIISPGRDLDGHTEIKQS